MSWWLAMLMAFGGFVISIVLFEVLTQGCVLVGPFLTGNRSGKTYLGFYLLDEKNGKYKWLIRPRGIPKRLGWQNVSEGML